MSSAKMASILARPQCAEMHILLTQDCKWKQTYMTDVFRATDKKTEYPSWWIQLMITLYSKILS